VRYGRWQYVYHVLKAELSKNGMGFRTYLISSDQKQVIEVLSENRDLLFEKLKPQGENLVPSSGQVGNQRRLSMTVTVEGATVTMAPPQGNDTGQGTGTFNFD